MEVVYCSSCGKRITQEEIDLGKAARSDADSFCAECVSEGAAPADAPASTTGQKGRRPASRRAPRARPGSMSATSVCVLLGAVAAVGAAAFAFGLRRRGRAKAREERPGPPPPTVVAPPATERHLPRVDPGARVEPPPVVERRWVPHPPPAPRPDAPPAAAQVEAPPDPPGPFAPREGEKVLYGWDWRRWLPGMQGERVIVRPGLNLIHANPNSGIEWTPRALFVVPERGAIRTRLFLTARSDVYLLVNAYAGDNTLNHRHTWKGVPPGKWFEGAVAMDEMNEWGPGGKLIALAVGRTAHQIVLYVDEGQPGDPQLYVSEIQVFAVE